jgi:hypothetical protein
MARTNSKTKKKPRDPLERPAYSGKLPRGKDWEAYSTWQGLMEEVKKKPGTRRWINRQMNKPEPKKSLPASETPPPTNKRKKKK